MTVSSETLEKLSRKFQKNVNSLKKLNIKYMYMCFMLIIINPTYVCVLGKTSAFYGYVT